MNNTMDNNTEWQNSYWKRLSHQRSIEQSSKPISSINQGSKFCTTLSDTKGNKNDLVYNRMSFMEEHQEYLNPFTKNWRESLRAWSSKYNEYSSSPRNTNKQSNKQWLETEQRKTSQKMEILQLMSKKKML